MAPPDDEPDAPRPCSPCRGTGSVLSSLGGKPSAVECPWCEGAGEFLAEHDAQAKQRAARGEEPAQAPDPG